MRKTTLIGLALVLALSACGSEQPTDTPTSAEPSNSVSAEPDDGPSAGDGEPVTVGIGETLTLVDPTFGDAVEVTLADPVEHVVEDQLGLREPGAVYVVVSLTLLVTDGDWVLSPVDFGLVAEDGTVYETDFISEPEGVTLTPMPELINSLSKGDSIEATLLFDVPKDALAGATIGMTLSGELDYSAFWAL